MKKMFLFIAMVLSLASGAQVTHVSLQASGLTCSMCSNSIDRALKTLDFISRVDADIKTYTFEISFKPNSTVSPDLIRRKVEQAGFSVSAFIITIAVDSVHVQNRQPVTIAGIKFRFTALANQQLSGVKKIRILDKGFVSPKEYEANFLPASADTFNATIL